MATTLFRRIALLPMDEQRPTFFQLWKQYKFSTGVLSIKARVPPGTVNAMLGNKPVPRTEAEKVLVALSALLQEAFTLHTVAVVLSAETEHTNGHPPTTERRGGSLLSAIPVPDAIQR